MVSVRSMLSCCWSSACFYSEFEGFWSERSNDLLRANSLVCGACARNGSAYSWSPLPAELLLFPGFFISLLLRIGVYPPCFWLLAWFEFDRTTEDGAEPAANGPRSRRPGRLLWLMLLIPFLVEVVWDFREAASALWSLWISSYLDSWPIAIITSFLLPAICYGARTTSGAYLGSPLTALTPSGPPFESPEALSPDTTVSSPMLSAWEKSATTFFYLLKEARIFS